MQKLGTLLLLIFAFSISLANGYADTIDSTTLIENAKQYEGTAIEYEGEIIGDIMNRGSYTWINVHDGNNALGVWVPAAGMKDVKYAGRYKYTGDIVHITGTFYRACAEHGGDVDIHAGKLEIIKQGSKRIIPFDTVKLGWSIGLAAAAILLVTYTRFKKIW